MFDKPEMKQKQQQQVQPKHEKTIETNRTCIFVLFDVKKWKLSKNNQQHVVFI